MVFAVGCPAIDRRVMIYYDFPKNFLFGTGSSCYQTEGSIHADGKTDNIWDMASHKYTDRFKAKTEPTSGFYKHFREDIKGMKEQGLRTFRFSFSWTRLLPTIDGEVNQRGIDFYNEMIDLLIQNDIEPFADIFHWDLPMYLLDIGGWLNRDIIHHFTRFAKVCFENFGDRVKMWSTMNEPSVFCFAPYIENRAWPPFAPNGTDTKTGLLCAHHAILCHYSAVKLYRSMGLDGKIGAVIAVVPVYPKDPSGQDKLAATLQMERGTCWWLDTMLLGHYPKLFLDTCEQYRKWMPEGYEEEIAKEFVPMDFAGVNYYYPGCAAYDENEPAKSKNVENYYVQEGQSFQFYPAGLYDILMYLKERYNNPELYITENGLGMLDSGIKDEMVHDKDRIVYLREHLRMVSRSIKAGCNVLGYYYWSNFDSFENAAGYTYRFGMNYVDFETGERTRKDSWYYYRDVIKNCAAD